MSGDDAVAASGEIEARPVRCELAIGIVTYNNAATVAGVAATARHALEKHFPGVPAVLIDADSGSTDATRELVEAADLASVGLRYEAPPAERVAVPFHGVPDRAAALRAIVGTARRLGARALVLLEADVTSITDDWIALLAGPAWEGRADLVIAAHARHRYDGTVTSFLLAPLVRALFGCRLQQPLSGAMAFSGRLVEYLADRPEQLAPGAAPELGLVGSLAADGFGLCETWLGPRRVESPTRPSDLPTLVAQTLGAIFTAMETLEPLWLGTRGATATTVIGGPCAPSNEPREIDVERMVDAFRRGLRDLTPVWELVLAPETFGDVLSLDAPDQTGFRFSDELWARTVYDFALAFHYRVVHREHLLRSLVPLYLGRTAAYVLATRARDAAAAAAHVETAAAAFERQKPYLDERWR